MLLHIIARGKIGRGPEAELVERYLKRIAWPTKVTELPESGGKVPPAAENSVTILLDEKGEQLGSAAFAKKLEALARRRQARGALPDRRRGRVRRRRAAGGRSAAGLRQGDLAAPPRPRDARRAIVPRDEPACEPPLSS